MINKREKVLTEKSERVEITTMKSVFVICPRDFFSREIAVTSRDDGTLGLPGGKVDPGESLREAAIRESWEEGFALLRVDESPFFSATVDGNPVYWFAAAGASILPNFKEKGRITPMWVDALDFLAKSNPAFKNLEAIQEFDAINQ